MRVEEFERKWQELSLEAITGMVEWRVQHPRATMREIETALDERLARVRAKMLEDTALASEAREWEMSGTSASSPKSVEPQGPVCPECKVVLKPRGREKRHLQSVGGAEVVLERQYGECPVCGTRFFPPG